MQMNRIFFCILLSMNFCSMRAYIFVGYGLKSPINQKQKVFLLGILHKLDKEIDEKQFEAMLEIIRVTEGFSADKKMKIFLEYPHGNIFEPSRDRIKSVVHGLMYYTKDLGLQNTTIEDCDIRKVSGAAQKLLSFKPEVVSRILEIIQDDLTGRGLHWQESFGCRLETLTFQDLFDDYDTWIHRCEDYKKSWKAASIKKAFGGLFQASGNFRQMLMEHLAENTSIDLNEKVWQYSLRYWEANGQGPRDLITYFVNAFANFLDMYMLHQILSLQKDPACNTIIVCTGSGHSYDIYKALKEVGYRDICDPIIDDASISPAPPLSSDYLLRIPLAIEQLESSMTRLEVQPECSGCCRMM